MKKNDKLVVIFGVVVLILASIGIIYYETPGETKDSIMIEDVMNVVGEFAEDLDGMSICVPDSDPLYALVATPLAVHYDAECKQEVIPMYVKNLEEPSQAITRLQKDYLFTYKGIDLDDLEYNDVEDFSIKLAMKYWDKSDAALIINNSRAGYDLGINAVPIASYLSIPVIVCDQIDGDVVSALASLEVDRLIVCGNVEGYKDKYDYLLFEDVDQILENSINLVKEKFNDLDYIAMANPIDAYPPEVLDSEEFYFGPDKVTSTSMNRDNMIKFVMHYFSANVVWKFKIPEDYKYALVELEGYNHDVEGVDDFGDFASFDLNPADGGLTLGAVSTKGGAAIRDGTGNVIADVGKTVKVLYDCGGKEYTVTGTGRWSLLSEGEISAKVTVKKLDNPQYPMMQGLSSVAPYLASYYKGIVFAKEEFAFTADDDIRTDSGKTAPGYYLPGRNPDLLIMSNRHVFDNIHEPLNKLLADIAELDYEKDSDIEILTEHYKDSPVYIAIVGGAVGLPRLVYQNEVEPIGDIDGDGVDDTVAVNFGGGGTQSDNIYGNIDPKKYDWSNQAQDVYAEDFPYIENIVGRITGWDVQDADALVLRSIFYDEMIENAELKEWKENFGNLYGGGLDFRKPLWVQTLNHLPISKQIVNLINTFSGGLLNFAVGPWKYDTGFSIIGAEAMEKDVGEDIGFNVLTAVHEAAMVDGLSDQSIDELKKATLWNKLVFNKNQIKNLAGEGNVHGREIMENSNFIYATGHGSPYNFGMDGLDMVAAGFDGVLLNAPNLWSKLLKSTVLPHFVGGFWGPGGSIGDVGSYTPRKIATVELGPSFMWIESCFVGKITGLYPQENIGQSFINSGVAALVESTTGSNIPGGYVGDKPFMFDTKLGTEYRYRQAQKDAENDIFPENHFGVLIYDDMCHYLADDDATVGEAFREAKNDYLPSDADWELWWSPPLSSGGDEGYGTHMASKYTSFFEYVLYGDPAFNPYTPAE